MVPNPLFQKLRDGSDFELDGLCLIQQGLNELSDHISKRDQRINELEYDIEEEQDEKRDAIKGKLNPLLNPALDRSVSKVASGSTNYETAAKEADMLKEAKTKRWEKFRNALAVEEGTAADFSFNINITGDGRDESVMSYIQALINARVMVLKQLQVVETQLAQGKEAEKVAHGEVVNQANDHINTLRAIQQATGVNTEES